MMAPVYSLQQCHGTTTLAVSTADQRQEFKTDFIDSARHALMTPRDKRRPTGTCKLAKLEVYPLTIR